MSLDDPPRLSDDPSASLFERELVRSWANEQPSAEARSRVLGLAAIATGGAVVATAGSLAPKALTATFFKWLLLGVLVSAGAGVVFSLTRNDDVPLAPRGAAAAAAAPTATPSIATEAAPSAAIPEAEANALPDAPPLGRASAAPPSTSATPSASASARHGTLGEQVVAMDSARAALAAGDTGRTLALLSDYEKRFPGGVFGEEAEALRVEALAKSGDRGAAKRAADRFLAAHPASPHAARVRAMVDSSTP